MRGVPRVVHILEEGFAVRYELFEKFRLIGEVGCGTRTRLVGHIHDVGAVGGPGVGLDGRGVGVEEFGGSAGGGDLVESRAGVAGASGKERDGLGAWPDGNSGDGGVGHEGL